MAKPNLQPHQLGSDGQGQEDSPHYNRKMKFSYGGKRINVFVTI